LISFTLAMPERHEGSRETLRIYTLVEVNVTGLSP